MPGSARLKSRDSCEALLDTGVRSCEQQHRIGGCTLMGVHPTRAIGRVSWRCSLPHTRKQYARYLASYMAIHVRYGTRLFDFFLAVRV